MIGRWLERRRFMRDHRWTGASLSAYLDGELSEHDRERLESHAAVCPECGRMLATLRRTLAALRGLGEDAEAPPGLADGVIERLHGGV